MSDTLIILLAWNEAACIGETVRELRRKLPDADLLVVDDGSTDGTALAARLEGACVVRHPFNLGVAAGESTGLIYASRNGYRVAVRMDGDGQHDPDSVPALLEQVGGGAQLVLGSRFLGAESFRSTALRRFGNQLLAWTLTRMTGRPVTDPTSGFRAFGREAMTYFAAIHPHEYPEPESILMAARKGLPIAEVAVKMRPRRSGQSSLTPIKSAFYMLKVMAALLIERLRPSS